MKTIWYVLPQLHSERIAFKSSKMRWENKIMLFFVYVFGVLPFNFQRGSAFGSYTSHLYYYSLNILIMVTNLNTAVNLYTVFSAAFTSVTIWTATVSGQILIQLFKIMLGVAFLCRREFISKAVRKMKAPKGVDRKPGRQLTPIFEETVSKLLRKAVGAFILLFFPMEIIKKIFLEAQLSILEALIYSAEVHCLLTLYLTLHCLNSVGERLGRVSEPLVEELVAAVGSRNNRKGQVAIVALEKEIRKVRHIFR